MCRLQAALLLHHSREVRRGAVAASAATTSARTATLGPLLAAIRFWMSAQLQQADSNTGLCPTIMVCVCVMHVGGRGWGGGEADRNTGLCPTIMVCVCDVRGWEGVGGGKADRNTGLCPSIAVCVMQGGSGWGGEAVVYATLNP